MATRSRAFTTSVNKFVRAATWLGPLDAPAVASLKSMATKLDDPETMSPAMLSAFGLTYRQLLKRAPDHIEEVDEFERLLDEGSEAE